MTQQKRILCKLFIRCGFKSNKASCRAVEEIFSNVLALTVYTYILLLAVWIKERIESECIGSEIFCPIEKI